MAPVDEEVWDAWLRQSVEVEEGRQPPEGEVSLSSVATHVKSVCAEEEVEVVGGG